ncbi:MAG TPA: hypothetical protein VGD69_07705 [Herpetosiphonaceae bacterium]
MSKPIFNSSVSLPDTATLEQALLTIPGVRGARVFLSDDGIGEIHVAATPRRSPKKVVRDIESFLIVRYAYRIDYRRISLVQAADNVAIERIALGKVETLQQMDGTFIEVELINGEQKYQAHYPVEDNAALAAGKATVAALNTLFSPRAPFDLGGVQFAEFGARQAVTAYVTCQESHVEHLLGTVFVRSCVAEAAARSVLAATNRLLAGWLSVQQHALVAELATA